MSAQANSIPVITITGLPPRDYWAESLSGLGIALLVLIAVLIFALRRAERPGPDTPARSHRLTVASATFAGAFILLLLVQDYSLVRSDELAPMALVGLFVLTGIGLVLFGIAEFWLGFWRPRRTRGWLVAGALVFGALFSGAAGAASWLHAETLHPIEPVLLQIAIVAAAAGIVWWCYLPIPRAVVAGAFD